MSKTTRTEKAGIDTDKDRENDVFFSVIPGERQQFPHPRGATYKVQVENQRDVNIEKVFKKIGKDFERITAQAVESGGRMTIDRVTLSHDTEHSPSVPIVLVTMPVEYKIVIGVGKNEERFDVAFKIEADCVLRESGR